MYRSIGTQISRVSTWPVGCEPMSVQLAGITATRLQTGRRADGQTGRLLLLVTGIVGSRPNPAFRIVFDAALLLYSQAQ